VCVCVCGWDVGELLYVPTSDTLLDIGGGVPNNGSGGGIWSLHLHIHIYRESKSRYVKCITMVFMLQPSFLP
jgi:hypothetical protein